MGIARCPLLPQYRPTSGHSETDAKCPVADIVRQAAQKGRGRSRRVQTGIRKYAFRARVAQVSVKAALASCSGSLRKSSAPRQEFHFMVTERGADTPRSAGYAIICGCFRGISQELTMTKSIHVSLAVLTLSTFAALAAHRTHHRHAIHSPAMNAFAGVGASPVVWTGFYRPCSAKLS
jgi:hypothetical protein